MLLEAFERSTEGINISNNNKIPILAFADDIVLLGKDQKEARHGPGISGGPRYEYLWG